MLGMMKDPVEGTARLVGYYETTNRNDLFVTIQAEVIVEADGVPPTPVETQIMVALASMPLSPGYTWEARIDRKNPTHVRVHRNDERGIATANMAAAKEQAERMAVAMRAGEDPGFGQGTAGGQPPRVQTAGAGERGGDTISQLERLARLRDQGVLTEAEFQSQKQRILSG